MSIVARRYAQALLNLATRDNQLDPVLEGLDSVADALAESPQLAAFLAEPRVPIGRKEAVVSEVVERAGVPPLLRTFVQFVTRKRRIRLLEDIRQVFHELVDERMGRANAVVTVAAQLSAEQEERLRGRLEALSGKEVRMRVSIDPDVLGGVLARIGSTVWDGTLRNQLTQIHQSIAKG